MPGVKLNQAEHECIQKKRGAKEEADDGGGHGRKLRAPAVKADAKIEDKACAKNAENRADAAERGERNPAAVSKKVQGIVENRLNKFNIQGKQI